ncbi:low molecular weight phosphatase family protein [Mycolicibacterium chlorophenolicum]|uniref:arsenate reductase/protein-tyrosine-phosphatase family protein n=1 Tax=Mycolicibacterium chlorophenolicum TaxID=37916 RepID=UPI002E1134D7
MRQGWPSDAPWGPGGSPLFCYAQGYSESPWRAILHILFVCTGNICRSPTAERLTGAFGRTHNLTELKSTSAGTRAVIGHPIHREAARVLERLGGDSSEFVARQITTRIASQADLVLTMTKLHRDAVLELAPHKLHRTYTLVEAAKLVTDFGASCYEDLSNLRPLLPVGAELDVKDPIGGDARLFATVGSQIQDALSPVLNFCHGLLAASKN